ncbi:MAG: hypothetical protein GX629_08190 [Phycisphaerae bacterium]|jgi:hypothetical protein|nr:hypothetical protein [Phycisphaerae bacterium]
MKKILRKMAILLVLMTMTFSGGCSPQAIVAAGTVGAVTGYAISLLFPNTTTTTTCFVDGVEVDCSTIGKCISE